MRDPKVQYWNNGKTFSSEEAAETDSAANVNTGAENAVEQAGIYGKDDAEVITRNTSGNYRAEGEQAETNADEVMDVGIEEADTIHKRRDIGL